MEDILILKDQYLPIEGVSKKPTTMTNEDWKKLDKKAIVSIRQYLAKNVYFNVAGETSAEGLWKKLRDLYEKNTASNKVFLMKKLYNLKMKEGASVAEHLNEFNIIINQLASIKIALDDEIIAILLMCSMPDSWENLIVAINTSATVGTLKFDDVFSSLMNEELRRKSTTESKGGEALTITDRGRKIERSNQGHSRSRGKSKSRRGKLTCFHCGKPGHMKKDCRILKREQNEQKSGNANKKSANTNEGETTAVVSDNNVLITISLFSHANF